MPLGKPNAQTKANAKWQEKAGYRTVAYKLRGDTPDIFAATCERLGRSKASVITELMTKFIEEHKEA